MRNKSGKSIAAPENIALRIVVLRGSKVLLDADLAELYGVETKALNLAVKRNARRFPEDFMFQLSPEEAGNLRFQIATSSSTHGGRRYRPYAFTEQGVAMLSSVLHSERAVQMNIAIMRAFVKLREAIGTNRALARQFAELERRVGRHDEKLNAILQVIRKLMTPRRQPRREIGFHAREAGSPKSPPARRR